MVKKCIQIVCTKSVFCRPNFRPVTLNISGCPEKVTDRNVEIGKTINP